MLRRRKVSSCEFTGNPGFQNCQMRQMWQISNKRAHNTCATWRIAPWSRTPVSEKMACCKRDKTFIWHVAHRKNKTRHATSYARSGTSQKAYISCLDSFTALILDTVHLRLKEAIQISLVDPRLRGVLTTWRSAGISVHFCPLYLKLDITFFKPFVISVLLCTCWGLCQTKYSRTTYFTFR